MTARPIRKATATSAGPTPSLSPTVRLLLALAQAEAMAAIGGKVTPSWCAGLVAKRYGVPVGELALAMLDKLAACNRARAEREAMDAYDAIERARERGK